MEGRSQADVAGGIGSGATSLTPNMGSIGELFMDWYIRFGRRSERLVREEQPWSKHHVLETTSTVSILIIIKCFNKELK